MDKPWVMIRRSPQPRPQQIIKATGPAPAWFAAGAESYTPLPDLSIYRNQTGTFRTSWVYSAVSILARDVATPPLMVKQEKNEKTEDIINHPFELLLKRPNPLLSRSEFIEAMVIFRALTGNAYIWLNKLNEAAPPSEMWIIPSDRIKPVPDGRLAIKGYLYNPGWQPEIALEPWEVVHLKTPNPYNPYVGLSPVEALAIAILGDKAMSEWNTNFFHKDNAKISGILKFADTIEDGQWEKMLADVEKKYGGTKRRLMMMRGTGQGAADFINTAMSQKDMEFLAGRQFSREEIYQIFAPGLYAMLNASSALNNARSNEATYMSHTVWPLLVSIAEKITNDILPAYGENLVCEFEDVRVRDRQMDLNEQEQAHKVMTVAEVREKYFDLPPLGDERDDKLVAQAGNPFGSSGPNPFANNSNGNKPPQLDDGKEEAPEDVAEEPVKARREVQPTKAQMVRDELRTWERFVVKRIKAGQQSWREFKAEFVPAALKAAIEGGLEAVSTPEGARLVFEDARRWEGYP